LTSGRNKRTRKLERCRPVGWCFVAAGGLRSYESGSTPIDNKAPERCIPGVIVVAVSLVVMPLLFGARFPRLATDAGHSG
jgi:hypothetical protein